MSATLALACPQCQKQMKVPAEFAGKVIRCKDCQATFAVPGPKAAKPVAKPARPAAPPAANAPIPFQDEPAPAPPVEEDGKNPNPYGVIKESDVPRCPFCALELDPPDTKVCLNCGYNMLERRRHGSRRVYETTGGEYFLHWLPAILFIILIGILITVNVICWLNMYSWLAGTILDTDQKNEITGEKEYYLKPWCFSLWISIFSVFFIFKMTKFVIRRLVFNWRPEEVVKKTGKGN